MGDEEEAGKGDEAPPEETQGAEASEGDDSASGLSERGDAPEGDAPEPSRHSLSCGAFFLLSKCFHFRHAVKLKEAVDADDKRQTTTLLQVWGSTWGVGDAPVIVEVHSF